MSEPRQCCFVNTSNFRCSVIQNLNRILILEPDRGIQEKWGCYDHLRVFIKEQCDDIDFKLRQLDNLKIEIEKSKKLDILHRMLYEQSGLKSNELKRVDDKRNMLKKKFDQEIRDLRSTCRSIYCRKPISANEVKCAIEIRSHYNTPRTNLYYHRTCIWKLKLALGFIMPIQKKQFTLDNPDLDEKLLKTTIPNY